MNKLYIKEKNGRKILYQENAFPVPDKILAELNMIRDNSYETTNNKVKYTLSEESESFKEIIYNNQNNSYNVIMSNAKPGIFAWNPLKKRHEYEELSAVNLSVNSSNNSSDKGNFYYLKEIFSWKLFYYGISLLSIILLSYFSLKNHSYPAQVIGSLINSIWSPVHVPVLNFLIDVIIVIVFLALLPGIVITLICIGLFILALIYILVFLASFNVIKFFLSLKLMTDKI